MLIASVCLINFRWHEFLVYCGTNRYLWVYNHVDAYWVLTSSEYLYFSLFECWLRQFIWWTAADMKFQVFLEVTKYDRASNEADSHSLMKSSKQWSLSLFGCWLYLFKLLLTWNSKFLWEKPHLTLQWDPTLRNAFIKIGKSFFAWTLIVSI